jgi:ADP-heptose:LPS heptosyltransferase
MNKAIIAARWLIYRTVINVLMTLVRPRHRISYRLTILKLDRLGDAVLSLGAVRKLLSSFREEETLLIVSRIAAPIYHLEFPGITLLIMPAFCERFWPDFLICMIRHAYLLRAITTETLVCLRHQHSDYLYAVALMLNSKLCYASRWEDNEEHTSLSFPKCDLCTYPATSANTCLELEAHRRVVEKFLHLRTDITEILPYFTKVATMEGNSLLVCPVSGSPIRQYPVELLTEAICLFLQQLTDIPVHFCLPPGTDCTPWEDALMASGLTNVQWHFPNDVESLVKLIAEARIVLAPDSAPAHIATALDKAGVFLLGGGHFGMFAPWRQSERQRWLNHATECYQCRWNCTQTEPYCVTQIDPREIASALYAVR